MREIKFRAWGRYPDRDRFNMFNCVSLEDTLCTVTPYVGDNQTIVDYTLMQYTSLKDKNGKEIYEGDIIKVFNWGRTSELLGITHVVWDLHECGWRYKEDLGADDFYDQFRRVEVIGNIYENPELLEKDNEPEPT